MTDFDEAATLGPTVELLGAQKTDVASAAVAAVEFTPLGGTERAETTHIWLACGKGEDRIYLSIEVNPVTGLATVGEILGASSAAVPESSELTPMVIP